MPAGVARGNGAEEERALYRELMDRWAREDIENQKELLRLSRVARYAFAAEHCHNVQMTAPELVVDEIRLVLDRVVRG